jgi:hypothetical protein
MKATVSKIRIIFESTEPNPESKWVVRFIKAAGLTNPSRTLLMLLILMPLVAKNDWNSGTCSCKRV